MVYRKGEFQLSTHDRFYPFHVAVPLHRESKRERFVFHAELEAFHRAKNEAPRQHSIGRGETEHIILVSRQKRRRRPSRIASAASGSGRRTRRDARQRSGRGMSVQVWTKAAGNTQRPTFCLSCHFFYGPETVGGVPS